MQTKQDGRLGTEKIGKLMLELALPSVLAQIVNVLYNIVDRIYIGRIPDVGSLALTGVGVTFPIITIISAFAGFASGGGAPLAAIALGQKNRDRAEKILGSSTSLLLFFSVCLMAFSFSFRHRFCTFWCKQQHNPIRFHVYFHLSCRNRICRAGCRIEYFYQLSGTRTHGHVLRSHWRCYQHWS